MAVTEQTYNDKFLKNLPTFVDANSTVLLAYATVVAKTTHALYLAITGIANSYWTWKGLKLTADENRILYKEDITDFDLQTKLESRYDTLKARGTEAGITDDLSNLDLDLTPDVEFYTPDETGWIIDVAYPDNDAENQTINFLDAWKVAKLNLSKEFTYGSAVYGTTKYGEHVTKYPEDLENIKKELIVPTDVELLYE